MFRQGFITVTLVTRNYRFLQFAVRQVKISTILFTMALRGISVLYMAVMPKLPTAELDRYGYVERRHTN